MGKGYLGFKGMTLLFAVRDLIVPPEIKLEEAGLKPGFSILDYGCGPGGYTFAAAERTGPSGKVYALDILPFAVQRIHRLALKKGLRNVEGICSDCRTGLNDGSIDLVMLYDVYHDLSNGKAVLKELHRVLKPGATLSFSDHHMNHERILTEVTGTNLFRLSERGKRTYPFLPV